MDYQIDHTNDYFQKGFQLYLLGRYADARKILQEGLITDPNNGPIHSLIAILYIHEEDSVQASKFADRGLELAPQESFTQYAKGVVLYKKDTRKAFPYFKEAAIQSPMQDLYQVRLAQIYLTLEQREEAKKHLAMALVLNPHNEEALALESTLAFQNDQPNKAAKLIDQALNINPTNPSLLKEKADQAAAKGDYDTASKLYEQVTTLEPDNWMVRDAFLDALLGKNPIYHWLVLKSNFLKRQPIFLVSCLVDIAVVILSFFLLGFFHDYPFLKVGPLILVVVYLVVRLCAWGTRLVSHTILSRKLWKLKLVDHLNFPNFLSMHMILMIVGYLLSLVWQVDLGMSIALSTICLLWISSLTFLIKDQTIRKILTYYVVCLYGLGALNLLLSILDIPASSFFSKVLFIGIFLGIVLAGFGTVKYSKES